MDDAPAATTTIAHATTRWRLPFAMALPLIWVVGAALGRIWRGDEYGLALMAFLPLVPLGPLIGHATLAFGTLLLLAFGAGRWLDRVHARWRSFLLLWGALALVLFVATVFSYASRPAAIAKNGPLIGYAVAAANAMLWPTIVFLGLGGFARRNR